MSAADVRHPIAHRFVDCFLECGLACGDGDYFRAEETHPRDVERLPLHVDAAHVDDALITEARRDRGGGDTMLPCAGLGDDARLAHAACEENLAECVIDFVRSG